MAIATVTWLPLLRPAYRACSGAAVVVGAVVVGAVVTDAAALPGLPVWVLARRNTTASASTEPSVIRGPSLVISYCPSPSVTVMLTITFPTPFHGALRLRPDLIPRRGSRNPSSGTGKKQCSVRARIRAVPASWLD